MSFSSSDIIFLDCPWLTQNAIAFWSAHPDDLANAGKEKQKRFGIFIARISTDHYFMLTKWSDLRRI